jgi:thiamine biosynthesis protein ThiI
MKGLLLISGGHDSVVAGHLMKQQGVEVIAVHFSNKPFTDDKPQELAERLLKKIGIKNLFIVEHGQTQGEFLKNAEHKFICIFCRRMMFRIAEKIAEREGCDFLITGENLGQVASQTLHNLTVTDSAVKIKIMRPLLGLDKREIMDIAKDIGTYDISSEPSICCRVVPNHPVTKCTIERIEKQEAKVDINKILKERLDTVTLKHL